MTKVNFYLRNKSVKKRTMINLIFIYENQKIKIPTGISVYPKYWNGKIQRVRELIEFPEHSEINDRIETYRMIMTEVYKEFWNAGIIPDEETLKKNFIAAKDNPIKIIKPNSFWEYFEEFIVYKKNQLGDIRDYDNSLRKHLKKIENILGKPITFLMLKEKNGGFIDQMDHYLTYEAINAKGEKGLSANTVGKQFKNLKVFLNWYFDKDMSTAFSLKHMVTKTEEVDNIYLTESDLEKIESISLEDIQGSFIRYLFIVGCETGLRFSDFTRIKKENIKNGNLYFRPKKTEGRVLNNQVVIPISSRLKKTLGILFASQHEDRCCELTEFNKTIRKICEKAKIDEDVLILKKIAGKTTEHIYKKYELVSSHTCRRTFCTLKYLAGMPAQAIMKFSGHKTERAFMKYLKLDAELVAIKYVDYFK